MDELTNTSIWELYKKGVDHHNKAKIYSDTEKAYNFYEDRQWEGVQNGGEPLPFFNFIKPIVKYKSSSIAMNSMAITFTAMDADPIKSNICQLLNIYIEKQWEQSKMDQWCWRWVKRTTITGDDYLYLHQEGKKCQLIDKTNVYLGDEAEQEIQNQPYILIYERLDVEAVRSIAEANGLDAELIESDEAEHQSSSLKEVKAGEGKVTSILKLWKENDIVHMAKSTKNLVYDQGPINGLTLYPIVSFVIEPLHNSARGLGEVRPLIQNQIEVNKTLYRRSETVKISAFPQIVFDETMIDNPGLIGVPGESIAMRGNVGDIKNIIGYLQPNGISSDAKILMDEIISITKDLSGAGDAALGQINPEQASGTAIIAVRDQASIPLNESVNSYKQAIEDYARVFYAMLVAYNPNGLDVEIETDNEGESTIQTIPSEILSELKVEIRVDVSNKNPYSKYAQEKSLENLFVGQHISLEEYIDLIDDSSSIPKNKMKELLNKRKTAAEKEAKNKLIMQNQQIPTQTMDPAMLQQAMMSIPEGGVQNAMQEMPM